MCIFPTYRTIYSPDEKKHKLVKTSCGKCPQCLSIKRKEWFFRLQLEKENSSSCYFATLTYNNDNLPLEDGKPVFSVNHIQLFLKRLRKYFDKHYKAKLRYFLASEYGDNFGRPHYHAIFFNLPKLSIYQLNEIFENTWTYGFVSVSPITDARINYVCKYMLKHIQKPSSFSSKAEAPFMLCSRRPAIGSAYLTPSNIVHHLSSESYVTNLHGKQIVLPRYLRRKIFDDYPDIKERVTNELIYKSTEKYLKVINDDTKYSQVCQTIHANNKNSITNYLKRFKSKEINKDSIDHLLTYLREH